MWYLELCWLLCILIKYCTNSHSCSIIWHVQTSDPTSDYFLVVHCFSNTNFSCFCSRTEAIIVLIFSVMPKKLMLVLGPSIFVSLYSMLIVFRMHINCSIMCSI